MAPAAVADAPLSRSEREELLELRRKLRQVKQERNILAKATALVRRQERADVHDVFELVKAIQADFPVRTACRVLQISPSGYDDWLDRSPSRRARANAELAQRIAEVHRASDATYGMPRVHAELAAQGVAAGRNRIARSCERTGFAGRAADAAGA